MVKSIQSISEDPMLTPQEAYEAGIAALINYLASKDKTELQRGENLLLQAAKAGYYPAQCYLGSLYLDGRLLVKNLEEGNKWLNKADKQKLSIAENKAIYWRPLPTTPSETLEEDLFYQPVINYIHLP